MYSVVHMPKDAKGPHGHQLIIFKQVDLPTKDDGDVWITENVSDDIENHWIIKTSNILKLNPWQRWDIAIDDKINLEETHSSGAHI